MGYITKVKKSAQRAGNHSGWNQHVDKWTQTRANKRIRRILKTQAVKEQMENTPRH